jgi:hypothetical protein
MVWWELVFMMFVLKIPIIYLCFVVRWAIRAEPEPGGGTAGDPGWGNDPPGWWRRATTRPGHAGPHGGPLRTPPRRQRRGAFAHGRVDR